MRNVKMYKDKISLAQFGLLPNLSVQVAQLPNGRWRVYSKSGKNLGTFSSRRAAKKRASQFEKFIRMNRKRAECINERKNNFEYIISKFSDLENVNLDKKTITSTYSSTMRDLRKNNPDIVIEFMRIFKLAFDSAVQAGLEDLEQVALLETVHKLDITNDSKNI